MCAHAQRTHAAHHILVTNPLVACCSRLTLFRFRGGKVYPTIQPIPFDNILRRLGASKPVLAREAVGKTKPGAIANKSSTSNIGLNTFSGKLFYSS